MNGIFGIIQKNAITSWTRFFPDSEVIIFGNEIGIAELAAETGVRHYPDVDRNEWGTPLVSSLMERAREVSRYDTLVFVNADLIILPDLMNALANIGMSSFLMTGGRWDVDIRHVIDFTRHDCESSLRRYALKNGVLSRGALDYFVYPRQIELEIPPMAIGRRGHDNFLIYAARKSGVPVIDATDVVTVLHQNHDYSHHPDGLKGIWEGQEAMRNLDFLPYNDPIHIYKLEDATHRLTAEGLFVSPLSEQREAARREAFGYCSHPPIRTFVGKEVTM